MDDTPCLTADDVSEGTLDFSIENFLRPEQIDWPQISPVLTVRGLPWRLLVPRPLVTEYFGLYIRCDYAESEDEDEDDDEDHMLRSLEEPQAASTAPWSCGAKIKLMLVSQSGPPSERDVTHQFTAIAREWGIPNFMPWSELTKNQNVFITDNKITFRMHLVADHPLGVRDYFPADRASKFSAPWKYSDVTFVVEGRHVFANRATLCQWSPVFEHMFDDRFEDSKCQVIPLVGKKFVDVCLFMEILHPSEKKSVVDKNNVYRVLPLCHYYQIQSLLADCERVLIAKRGSIEHLFLADLYQLEGLQDWCLHKLQQVPMTRLKAGGYFDKLSSHLQAKLLNRKVEFYERLVDHSRELDEAYRTNTAMYSVTNHYNDTTRVNPATYNYPYMNLIEVPISTANPWTI